MDSKKATVMSDGSIFIVPEQDCALQGRIREFFLDFFPVEWKWMLSASAYLHVSCKKKVWKGEIFQGHWLEFLVADSISMDVGCNPAMQLRFKEAELPATTLIDESAGQTWPDRDLNAASKTDYCQFDDSEDSTGNPEANVIQLIAQIGVS